MSILPNAAADGDETSADADVSEQHERGLHGISDGEESVLALRQPPDEQNSARKSNDLDRTLNDRVTANAASMTECSP